MRKSQAKIDRRGFPTGSAALIGGAAIAPTASSYSRILGANERISLAHIGPGNRGQELAWVVAQHKTRHNVEMTAVCDLWRLHQERAVAENTRFYGRSPRAYQYLEDVLRLQDVDAVIISTPEHSHSPILKLAAEAGKDAYVEKPMGNVLAEVKAARDAVKQNQRIVQVGTQHRSEPYPAAARDVVQNGTLGDVSKIEIVWNYHGPRWRGREETKQIREPDTDWRKWLMTKPYRPFDPQVYCEFRLYKEFSSGIPDQWMSHATDLVHWFMNDSFPRSVVAHGGIFAWRDGRENPDTFQALLEYPKGFLVSYSTSFGNDCDSFSRLMGKKATLINIGGEGSPRWKLVEEKGTYEDNPSLKRPERYITLPGDDKIPPTFISDNATYHMENWFECLRSRKQPNATVRHGYSHAVAVIMAARAYREGKKLWWDSRSETIVDHAPEV